MVKGMMTVMVTVMVIVIVEVIGHVGVETDDGGWVWKRVTVGVMVRVMEGVRRKKHNRVEFIELF